MNKKMSVAVNRRTKELVGYWRGKDEAIVVTDYSIIDLTKKFDKVVAKRAKIKSTIVKYYKNIQYMIDQEENQTKLMVATSKKKIL